MNLIKKRNNIWQVCFRYRTQTGEMEQCRKSTGLAATKKNKPEALRMALSIRDALLHPQNEIPKKPKIILQEPSQQVSESFEKVSQDYVQTLEAKGLKKSTLKAYRSILRIHLRPQFGKTPVSEITTRRVDKWFSSLKGHNNKPLSGKTRNNIINFLAEIMSKAVAWEYCKENPVKHISRSKLKEQEMLFWSKEERDSFLSAAYKREPQLFALFATFLFTGMRVGEVIALRWEHVDLSEGTIHIQHNFVEKELTLPKSGKSRIIHICPFLGAVLNKHLQNRKKNSILVFETKKGNYLTNDRIRRPFERIVKHAKVPKIRIHDMRHTFASLALMSGVDVPTVQKWLGHKDIQTTMRYIKLLPKHMQEQAKKLTPNLDLDDLFKP